MTLYTNNFFYWHNEEMLINVSGKLQNDVTECISKTFTENVVYLFSCNTITARSDYNIIKLFFWLCLGSHSTWLKFGKYQGLGLHRQDSGSESWSLELCMAAIHLTQVLYLNVV